MLHMPNLYGLPLRTLLLPGLRLWQEEGLRRLRVRVQDLSMNIDCTSSHFIKSSLAD